MLAIAGLWWRSLAEHRDAQAEAHRLGIAPRFRGHLAKARRLGLEARQAVERILRVGADRIPGIADARSPPQRRTALASDPDRRMRLLHGLRVETEIGEPNMLAVEFWRVHCPEFDEGTHILVGYSSTRIEIRRVDGLVATGSLPIRTLRGLPFAISGSRCFCSFVGPIASGGGDKTPRGRRILKSSPMMTA
jgi:hypothetical protein